MVCAWLEERGYRLDQIRHLTRGYVATVIGWPTDKEGRLRDPRPPRRPPSRAEQLRRHLFLSGYRPDRIERRVREILAEESAQAEAARTRPAAGRRGGTHDAQRR